jgi:hypothetical protein
MYRHLKHTTGACDSCDCQELCAVPDDQVMIMAEERP